MCWSTRTYTAAVGKGAYANGQKLSVTDTDKVEQSLLVSGYGYDHDDSRATKIRLDFFNSNNENLGLDYVY
nr:phosphatase IMPL1, chloroplastic [Ipomoea batatas]GMC85096.1 phosphatase IMPL1, chloroplastic [Ipomoea batatas]GMC88312.1 phosphatase IMPL1, chloroplastic [Ipomoea batatas]